MHVLCVHMHLSDRLQKKLQSYTHKRVFNVISIRIDYDPRIPSPVTWLKCGKFEARNFNEKLKNFKKKLKTKIFMNTSKKAVYIKCCNTRDENIHALLI